MPETRNSPVYWLALGAVFLIVVVLRFVEFHGLGFVWVPAALGTVLCWANAVRLWRKGN